MRKSEIEAWALSVLEFVSKQHRVEADRVELKREWISPPKAARRIAAHANAAGGEPILWLIGVDEEKGVLDLKAEEFASWWLQVRSQFEATTAPTPEHLVISFNTKPVTAVLFKTDSAPFLVKNPSYGGSGEKVEWEVPWREGTTTRTAHRADLLRLLAPRQHAPHIEVLGGVLSVENAGEEHKALLHLKTQIFVEQITGRAIFSKHRCSGRIEAPQHKSLALAEIATTVADPGPERGTFSNRFIACFSEPGVLELEAFTVPSDPHILECGSLEVSLTLTVNSPIPLHTQFTLHRRSRTADAPRVEWGFGILVSSEEDTYKTWVNAVVHSLLAGPGNAVEYTPDQQGWAARAVGEGRLAWTPLQRYLMLPSSSIDRF